MDSEGGGGCSGTGPLDFLGYGFCTGKTLLVLLRNILDPRMSLITLFQCINFTAADVWGTYC